MNNNSEEIVTKHKKRDFHRHTSSLEFNTFNLNSNILLLLRLSYVYDKKNEKLLQFLSFSSCKFYNRPYQKKCTKNLKI